MKKVLLLSLFLMFIFQVRSQNAEVEIYMVQTNTIVKGTIEESSSDSLRIRVDSLQTLTFTKTELEGRELPFSKETKKLCKKLIRNELSEISFKFPGIYQMRNGEREKGKIMFTLATLGIIGGVGALVVFYVGIVSNPGLGILGLFIAFDHWAYIMMPSLIISESSRIWNTNNQLHRIKKLVNNRYYYRGAITPSF